VNGVLGYDNPTELSRLLVRERLIDADTCSVLGGLGVRRSWHCLEVGAGTGSIARWLAAQCPEGRVVATDIDTRHRSRGGQR
jgi:methylase of polypeptide subunit release factors